MNINEANSFAECREKIEAKHSIAAQNSYKLLMSTAKMCRGREKNVEKNEYHFVADSLFLLLIFHMSFFPCWIDFL